MTPEDVLDLHRRLVATPSVSHEEDAAVALMATWLEDHGAAVEVLERNVIAWAPGAPEPRLLLNSHLDTVPPTDAWTKDPWEVRVVDGRVEGLGANDAKASVAAMAGAFVAAFEGHPDVPLGVAFVADEETGGRGTEIVLPHLDAAGWALEGAVVGEPTDLDVAVAQKGMIVLELIESGDAGHVANAAAVGARNAVRLLARDLLALDDVDLGPPHADLGAPTCEPTIVSGGCARNIVPDRASCFLDIRTTPGTSHAEIVSRLDGVVSGELRAVSTRLQARECPRDAAILRAALAARPHATTYGSSTMSDWVYFETVPAIKCGPGKSSRSHTPDEFVLESEVLDGFETYGRIIHHFFEDDA